MFRGRISQGLRLHGCRAQSSSACSHKMDINSRMPSAVPFCQQTKRHVIKGNRGWHPGINIHFVTRAQVSACSAAERISESGIPLHLVAGWLDSTASPAIVAFVNAAAKTPGGRLKP